jgi:hypothetical protein
LLESGLKLEEPAFVERNNQEPGLDYEKNDFFHEKRNIPFPPEKNRLIREKINQKLNRDKS